MTDVARILALWREVETAGADYVLATIVAVQGPSYRKPGALMLLTTDGRRAGMVSGGCLEGQVASRAWWLTANGPTIERYSTADEDGDRPYGSGCGGVVFLLLERRATANPLLTAIGRAFDLRVPLAVATVLEGRTLGQRALAGLDPGPLMALEMGSGPARSFDDSLSALAQLSVERRGSIEGEIADGGTKARAWADYRPPRPGLAIFGAGDDAQPLLKLAKELGWYVSIADGRRQLVTRERFPEADQLTILPIEDFPSIPQHESQPAFGNLHREDAAVVMTHSFEQDSRILACLLAMDAPPAYIGVLGPQRRTYELLNEAARLLKLPANAAGGRVDRWLAELHAPTGLDLGAESPATIALSVLAEIQKFRTSATALPLRSVRAAAQTIAS